MVSGMSVVSKEICGMDAGMQGPAGTGESPWGESRPLEKK